MEHVKEAFSKVKQDIDFLKKEVSSLNEELKDTRQRLVEICDVLKVIAKKSDEQVKKEPQQPNNSLIFPNPTHILDNPTDTSLIPTNPAHNSPYKALKDENKGISTGNQGVPTDRQTNQQTNQQTDKGSYNQENNLPNNTALNSNAFIPLSSPPQVNSIDNAAKILDSLDNLKKEVRLKFKKLTEQEFTVFSTLYQLSEENQYTDYKNLSIKLGLTESSIRDYIGRLIKKGIPVEKSKINNKTVQLSISPNLRKIASLPTILQLRAI